MPSTSMSARARETHLALEDSPRIVTRGPTIRVIVAELNKWIAAAEAGHILEYHRGFLVFDRVPAGSRLSREDSEELDRVARTAMALAESDRVRLVQRRHGDGDYCYQMIAAAKRPIVRAQERAAEFAS